MAIIDGTQHAVEQLEQLFRKAQELDAIPNDAPFEPREVDQPGTAIRLVAVDPNGIPYPGIHANGVRTITDSTRVAPLERPIR